MNRVHFGYFRRLTALLLVALLLLAALACTKEQEVPVYGAPDLTLREDELPNPLDSAPTEDTTDYEGLAAGVFEGAATAATADFTFEAVEGGLMAVAYGGTGGVVVIPDEVDGAAVVALGDGLFKDNTALTALFSPDTVTSIGTELLSGCRALTALRTPQLGAQRSDEGYLAYLFGGKSAQAGAFKIGSSLDTVILSDVMVELPSMAFYSCYRLVMVILPEGMERIGSYAFYGCSSLRYAPLRDSLREIGDGAFAECTSLLGATVPDTVERIGLGAWMSCTAMERISLPFVGETRSDNTHLGYIFGAESYTWNRSFLPARLQSVAVRSGDIPNYAFYECVNLYRVTLPQDCTSIGVRAFHGASSLLSIDIPDSVTHIGDMAFSDCAWLREVSLGDGLVEIGMQAFMGCINLVSIEIPDEVTMLTPSLFSGCKRLEAVVVGDGLTTIDDGVFHNCISLSSVTTRSGATVDASVVNIGRDNGILSK
ncbi:MAG: leucine-rich repeat domain-containing protein [Clostridia bacterium]|nr:leucine-rich repeat domain-containing protein [Clostridia bacterium]